jgi:hypothetical protein
MIKYSDRNLGMKSFPEISSDVQERLRPMPLIDEQTARALKSLIEQQDLVNKLAAL